MPIDPITDNEGGIDVRTKLNDAISAINALGDAATKDVGTSAGTVAAGDDSRFSNARTPTAHASTHQHGGADEVATTTPAANAIPKAGAGGKLDGGWLPYGSTGSTACEGNDARLSDARTPTAHANSHVTGGADKIRDATASLDGLMTAAHAAKLDGIETGADVTDAANVGAAIAGATTETTLGDTDEIPFVAGSTLKNIAYSALKTLLNALYAVKGAITGSGLTMASGKLLGRGTAGTGAIEEITLGTNLSLSGNTLNATGSGGGGGSTNIFIGAGEFIPRTTNGCGINSCETSTNRVNYDVLEFDPAAIEYAQALRVVPNNWNAGTITFKPIWTAASGSGDVVWSLSARAYANDDAIDQATGTNQTSTDTLTAAADICIGPASSAITMAGTAANGNPVIFEVARQATSGSDTLAVDAQLIGIEITYTASS